MNIKESPRSYFSSQRWDYNNYFREYLLLLARKRELGLEFIKNYPAKIELSSGWHNTLNKVRDTTKDGNEHWGYIGFKSDRRSIWFSSIPVTGYGSYISGDLIKEELNNAKCKHGIVDLMGDIHSHPNNFSGKEKQKLHSENPYGLKAIFSAGDLYILVNTEHFRPLMGIVEGNYNLFAFRTRETVGLNVNSMYFNQDTFEKYWYEKNGFKYLGGVEEYGAYRVTPISSLANQAKINIEIAERHNLVLYQGEENRDLERIFPK